MPRLKSSIRILIPLIITEDACGVFSDSMYDVRIFTQPVLKHDKMRKPIILDTFSILLRGHYCLVAEDLGYSPDGMQPSYP